MKRISTYTILILLVVFNAAAQVRVLADADKMYSEDMLAEGFKLLLSGIPRASDAERVKIYWRLSMFRMSMTDELEEKGATKGEILKGFEKGIEYATKAIQLDGTSVSAYFYRAANLGRWSETKGSLAALSRAKMMRDDLGLAVTYKPDHGDSWHVLGKLYAEVPGRPIGFGNRKFAVSLARKSLEHQSVTPDYSYYIELANHLIDRDWSIKKRDRNISGMKQNFDRKKNTLAKYCYYEGQKGLNGTEIYSAVKLHTLSDEEEAKAILHWILKTVKSRTEIHGDDSYFLEEAEEILSEL
ncbi:MAG: hypothetical protein GY765_13675 [bacterium]|nr:hypothetical protein [bacterium]